MQTVIFTENQVFSQIDTLVEILLEGTDPVAVPPQSEQMLRGRAIQVLAGAPAIRYTFTEQKEAPQMASFTMARSGNQIVFTDRGNPNFTIVAQQEQ